MPIKYYVKYCSYQTCPTETIMQQPTVKLYKQSYLLILTERLVCLIVW